MFLVKFFKFVFVSSSKINLEIQKIYALHRKSGYIQNNHYNLISTCPMGNTPITMNYRFEVLPTPVKSSSDKKEYKVIQLENGLIACLISDTSTPPDPNESEESSEDEDSYEENSSCDEDECTSSDEDEELPGKIEQKMAAAGLCVGVGSFSDPKDVPGMAHFLEHMVFMGSEKFHAENDFDSFIKKGGGSNNASTDTETTCFYFECLEPYLNTGLDKLAQFFIKPLMKKNAITREREAIESEFQMALPSDSSKKEQLLCSFANPETPVNSFSWGNLVTLRDNISDDKLYEGVHEFRKRHYSAHRMTLAVQARLPLDTLQNYVLEHFSAIPNNKLPPDDFTRFIPSVFNTPEFSKIYYVKPTKDISHIDLTWALPPLIDKYKTNPLHYLSHLLGDEGNGSLTAYLKKKLWTVGVTAGTEEGGMELNSIYSFFSVTIVLTDEGINHIKEIIEAVYSYINLLKKLGPQERIFDEIKLIADTAFQFSSEQTASDTVETMCESMQFYPSTDYITGSDIFYEYNEEILRKITDGLNPNKMNIQIWTKKLPDHLKFNKKEQWFETEYADLDIPSAWLEQWKNAPLNPELQIPSPNPYVSKNFSILPESDNHSEYPKKIVENQLLELWYRKDQKFNLPIAYFRLYLISPLIQKSAENSAMLDLMVTLLLFAFSEDMYPAICAGLNPNFVTQERGLVVKLNGYNDKLPVLVENIAVYLSQLNDKIDEALFKVLKDKLKKSYYNKLIKPAKLAKDICLNLLLDKFFTPVEKYKALVNISVTNMKKFINAYLASLSIRCLVQGNVTEAVAKDTINKFTQHLKCSPLSQQIYPSFRVYQVPTGEKCVSIEGLNKEDTNSIVVNYYQASPFLMKDSAIIDVIMQIIEEPAFDILRTKEQLGYHVDCSARNTFGVLGYMVKVECQATKYSTDYVDERIEEFLIHSQKLLEEMTEDQLNQIKGDLIKTKEVADVHLQEEVGRNWEEIVADDYMFDRNKQEIRAISTVTLKELRDWWKRHNKFGNEDSFRKISIQIVGHYKQDDNKMEEDLEIESPSQIKLVFLDNEDDRVVKKKDYLYFICDIEHFKESVYLYPPIVKK